MAILEISILLSAPCMMCAQYRGGFHKCCGGYLEYRGGCSVLWGYQANRGYLECHGGYSVPWGFMMHVGDIMSTVGVFSTVGDIIFCNFSAMGHIMIHVGDIMRTVGVLSTVGVLK